MHRYILKLNFLMPIKIARFRKIQQKYNIIFRIKMLQYIHISLNIGILTI